MAGVSLFKSFFFVIISVLGFAVCFQTVFQFAVFLFRNGFSSKVIGSQQQHEQQQSQRESSEGKAFLDLGSVTFKYAISDHQLWPQTIS